jgi:septal ring factor EnvC (AmiA/AmiB activator)
MELCAQDQHRLVGGRELVMTVLFALIIHFAHAEEPTEAIQQARTNISETERKQREALAHLFSINLRIKDIAKKKARLNDKLMAKEAEVRESAQDVNDLEAKAENHKGILNQRLRQLYQDRSFSDVKWLFNAKSAIEIEQTHRFLRLMVDSDYKQVKEYLAQLDQLKKKRKELAGKVAQLVQMQKGAQAQEKELAVQMGEKSKMVAALRKSKDSNLSKLKTLRGTVENPEMDYAFFERKGTLRPPVDARLAREYGTFVDPQFRFKLMYKGNFYHAPSASPVLAVFSGKVALATQLPGYGRTVIVDHGDNYYTIYAFASELKVREGHRVKEGDIIASSGLDSPLFGPGLYFEIRHFTDAVDPRPWIKEPGIKTASKEDL